MGGISGGGGSGSTSLRDTGISKKQLEILNSRESDYQSFFSPILKNQITKASGNVTDTNYMRSATQNINQQSAQSGNAFKQQMAQRGLSGSGVEAQGLASINNNRNQALGNAYYQASAKQDDQLMRYLQLGLNMSPAPTQAVPMGQRNSSTGWDAGL